MSKIFQTMKEKLLTAPVLGLPELKKPFDLFEHERQVVRLEVLTQNLRNTKCPVSYLSKTLDIIIQGWSTYLSVIAATRDLLQEAEDFTLG